MSSSAQATPPSVPDSSDRNSACLQGPPEVGFHFYRPPQSAGTSASPDLPESFFTPSTADLKAAQDSLSARTQALVNAPLRTQAMRDARLKAKLSKWPTTTIRVRFSDRSQLEKTFSSTDKIRSVYAFVRGTLREDVKSIKFVLYQTPPKRELKVSDPTVRDQTLFELQLAPSSVLHLKFEDDTLNHIDVPAPLGPTVLERAEDLPNPPSYESPDATPVIPKKTTGSSSSTGNQATTKVPKWLKLGSNK